METKLLNDGLPKLTEELGELSQVIGKLMQFPGLADNIKNGRPAWHPDGNDMKQKLIEEMGDVFAAINYVGEKLKIDPVDVIARAELKLSIFAKWDTQKH